MQLDLVIRAGTVIDGTGAAPRRVDVGISGQRVVAVEPHIDARGTTEIDAEDKVVTPGFVDIHTHLDAQVSWDPMLTPSVWHGVTSVVMGNCGVTFAPCRPDDRQYLAELMESVEDIPRAAILEGLPWDWTTYGEYLASVERMPKGINVGGMVGHCAVRYHVMGERSLDEEPADAADIAAIADCVDEAMRAGALGFSTSRTFMHRVPDGRPVPGTYASTDELLAIADVMRRHRRGVFESASRLGERDNDDLVSTRAELAWMGEASRRSGRPVSFGLTQSDRRPDLYHRVVSFAREENKTGAQVRPQTTARGVGLLFGLDSRTPWDRAPAWSELRDMSPAARLLALRDPARRARLIQEAEEHPAGIDLDSLFVLPPDGRARYDCQPEDSLSAHAQRRGICAAGAFIELALETDGGLVVNYPLLNQRLTAIEEMLDDPLVTLGLADAGAHVSQIMDASQPTFFLTYWVRERERWPIEEAVRRLTSDTAELFGIRDRGVLREGAFADVNVIDFDGLTLYQPEFVRDMPNGAGRYVQRADGFDYTIVNGTIVMDHGQHCGVFPGRLLRSTD
jgi:N-acyl-D-aspartate/D-glutamate deacylase